MRVSSHIVTTIGYHYVTIRSRPAASTNSAGLLAALLHEAATAALLVCALAIVSAIASRSLFSFAAGPMMTAMYSVPVVALTPLFAALVDRIWSLIEHQVRQAAATDQA